MQGCSAGVAGRTARTDRNVATLVVIVVDAIIAGGAGGDPAHKVAAWRAAAVDACAVADGVSALGACTRERTDPFELVGDVVPSTGKGVAG